MFAYMAHNYPSYNGRAKMLSSRPIGLLDSVSENSSSQRNAVGHIFSLKSVLGYSRAYIAKRIR